MNAEEFGTARRKGGTGCKPCMWVGWGKAHVNRTPRGWRAATRLCAPHTCVPDGVCADVDHGPRRPPVLLLPSQGPRLQVSVSCCAAAEEVAVPSCPCSRSSSPCSENGFIISEPAPGLPELTAQHVKVSWRRLGLALMGCSRSREGFPAAKLPRHAGSRCGSDSGACCQTGED